MKFRQPIIIAVAAFLSVVGVEAAPVAVQSGESNDGGIAVKWTYAPRPDAVDQDIGTLDVFVRDSLSSAPIIYGPRQLVGWLQRDRHALSDKEQSCEQRAKSFFTQGVGQRSDIDLNTYRIMTLNTDGSVAFINPFVGFNNAKLEAILDLKERPVDWLINPKRMEAWVLLAEGKKLVSIDLQSRKLIKEINFMPSDDVHNLFIDSDDKIVLPMPNSGKIGFLDPDTALLTFVSASGLKAVLPVTGVEKSYVSGVASFSNGDIRLLQRDHLTSVIKIEGTPTTATFSALAQKLMVTNSAGELLVVDGADTSFPNVTRKLLLKGTAAAAKLLDNGRNLFILGGGAATVIDLAYTKEIISVPTSDDANKIVETDQFVYATGSTSGRALLFAKDDLKHGKNQSLDVMLSSPEDEASPVSGAGRVVASADGNGVLVASGTDGMIYQYSEGMMAPSGSFSNYRRGALGVAIVDYSLKEVRPGHYRGIVRPDRSGRYDLVLAGSAPKFAACGSLALSGQSTALLPEPNFKIELVSRTFEKKIRLRVTSQLGGLKQPVIGLTDLTLLIFDKRSGWQRRVHMRETAGGEYEVSFTVPQAANYSLLAQSASANLSYLEGNMGEVELGARK